MHWNIVYAIRGWGEGGGGRDGGGGLGGEPRRNTRPFHIEFP